MQQLSITDNISSNADCELGNFLTFTETLFSNYEIN